jgi:hypothetical protein
MIAYTESNSACVEEGLGESLSARKRGPRVSLLGLRLLQNGIMENVSASRPGDIRAIPPRSSARSLLRHAGKWVGADLEKCMKEVYASRGEVEF